MKSPYFKFSLIFLILLFSNSVFAQDEKEKPKPDPVTSQKIITSKKSEFFYNEDYIFSGKPVIVGVSKSDPNGSNLVRYHIHIEEETKRNTFPLSSIKPSPRTLESFRRNLEKEIKEMEDPFLDYLKKDISEYEALEAIWKRPAAEELEKANTALTYVEEEAKVKAAEVSEAKASLTKLEEEAKVKAAEIKTAKTKTTGTDEAEIKIAKASLTKLEAEAKIKEAEIEIAKVALTKLEEEAKVKTEEVKKAKARVGTAIDEVAIVKAIEKVKEAEAAVKGLENGEGEEKKKVVTAALNELIKAKAKVVASKTERLILKPDEKEIILHFISKGSQHQSFDSRKFDRFFSEIDKALKNREDKEWLNQQISNATAISISTKKNLKESLKNFAASFLMNAYVASLEPDVDAEPTGEIFAKRSVKVTDFKEIKEKHRKKYKRLIANKISQKFKIYDKTLNTDAVYLIIDSLSFDDAQLSMLAQDEIIDSFENYSLYEAKVMKSLGIKTKSEDPRKKNPVGKETKKEDTKGLTAIELLEEKLEKDILDIEERSKKDKKKIKENNSKIQLLKRLEDLQKGGKKIKELKTDNAKKLLTELENQGKKGSLWYEKRDIASFEKSNKRYIKKINSNNKSIENLKSATIIAKEEIEIRIERQNVIANLGSIYEQYANDIYENLYSNNNLELVEVNIEFESDQIKNIQVWGTMITPSLDSKNTKKDTLLFQNRVPISYSTKRDVSRDLFKDVKLFHNQEYYGRSLYVKFSDVFYNRYKLLNNTENYSPIDGVVTIKPGQKGKILFKEKTINILQAKIFSDFVGLDAEQPNGLIQTEISKRIFLNSSIKQFGKRYAYYGFLNSMAPKLTLSKLEENNRSLLLKPLTTPINGYEHYVSSIDIYRHQNFSVGGALNLFYIGLPKMHAMIYFNGGAFIGRTAVAFPIPVDSLNSVPVEPDAFSVNSIMYYPEIDISINPHPSYRFSFDLKYSSFKILNEDFQQINSPKNFFADGEDVKNRLVTFKFTAALKPRKDIPGELFFRWMYSFIPDDRNLNFLQAQVGYSFNILSSNKK